MPIAPYFRKAAFVAALLSAALVPMPCAKAQVSVTTYHNDTARTGQNLSETVLTPASVHLALFTRFGKLFTLPVDGEVYAQPLYLSGVSIPNGSTHNILYVATEHDSVYAFDAASGGAPLWKRTLTQTAVLILGDTISTVPWGETTGNPDITPEIGITGTPVIDPESGTLYVVYKVKEVFRSLPFRPATTSYHQFLVALDIHTGATKASVEIQGSVPGSGEGGDGHGNVVFSPLHQNQRGALLLSGGVVYVPFGSHGDQTPYHGWILGYDAATLHRVSIFCSTPNATSDGPRLAAGGIWMAGDGPAADGSGLYVMTGNGKFDANTGGIDYGDSFLRLRPDGLTVADYFTPFNQDSSTVADINLTATDTDLGSGGNILLPPQPGSHPNLVVGCGKEGKIYLIDRNAMGHFHVGTDAVVQTLPNAVGGTWSTPAYFHGHLYYIGTNDVLKSFPLSGGLLGTTPLRGAPSFGYPGATPSVSANGDSNGIVWAVASGSSNDTGLNGPGTLYAYNAVTLAPLYNSNNTLDHMDHYVKFCVPTVANGRVYVGTQTNVTVYGLIRSVIKFPTQLNPFILAPVTPQPGPLTPSGKFNIPHPQSPALGARP